MLLSIRISHASPTGSASWTAEVHKNNRVSVFSGHSEDNVNGHSIILRGIIQTLQTIPPDEKITITSDDESFTRLGNWLVGELEIEILKTEIFSFYDCRNYWRQLFALTPDNISFHYDNSPLRSITSPHSLERMRDATRRIESDNEEPL